MLVALIAALRATPKPSRRPPRPAKPKHPKGWPLPAAGPTMTGDPELIFTFDDGPNPKTTPVVLDALAKHHIHAVFFMVGEMAANNEGAPAIIAARSSARVTSSRTTR